MEQRDRTVSRDDLYGSNREEHDRLQTLCYDELRRRAAQLLHNERPNHTLQPTALVHEVYLKLCEQGRANFVDQTHFLSIAAQAMRRVLIDYGRRRRREKRGGQGLLVTLEKSAVAARENPIDLLLLDTSLSKLSAMDSRQAEIVNLRFFGGLSVEETAKLLGVSPKTVKRDWALAKAWLYGDMRGAHDSPSGTVAEDQGSL
jgi:RNA polymerase sigma factor (TIGR02999 family)